MSANGIELNKRVADACSKCWDHYSLSIGDDDYFEIYDSSELMINYFFLSGKLGKSDLDEAVNAFEKACEEGVGNEIFAKRVSLAAETKMKSKAAKGKGER